MAEWYYQNKRGDCFEIYDLNPESADRRFPTKRFLAYYSNQNRERLQDNDMCCLDFTIERNLIRDFDDEILEKIFFRWGAQKIAEELEKENPQKKVKFITYDKRRDLNFTKHNWFLKYPIICSHRKKKNGYTTCSINDESKSSSEYTSELACEHCIVPDDFNRCTHLTSRTDTGETGKYIKSRNSVFGECMIGIPIQDKSTCFRCNDRKPIFLTIHSLSIESIVDEIKEVKEVKTDDVKEMQEKRSQFLQKLFELSKGDEHQILSMYKIAEELGYDKDTVNSIEGYLESEGLVKWQSTGGYISIKHEGVVKVEEALTKTDEPTEHLPSGTSIISIGHVEGSQIMQGSPDAKQIIATSEEKSDKHIPKEVASSATSKKLKKRRKMFGWIFGISITVSILLSAVSYFQDFKFQSSPPINDIPPAFEMPSVDIVVILSVITLLTSLASLIGFFSTTVLAWRRDRRDSRDSELELKKKKLEIEKLETELGRPKINQNGESGGSNE